MDGSENTEVRERGSGIFANFSCAVRTQIEIHATPERIWSILTSNESYHEWNPFIRELRGTLEVGRRLHVTVGQDESDLLQFEVRITKRKAAQELRWSSRYGLPLLIDTEHYFELEEQAVGGTRLIHGENFWGFLIPRMVRPGIIDAAAGFNVMNRALKAKAEAR